MSRFSDSLNEVIKKYESLNIYNIAKEIGCDRSWLQKVVSGDRNMNFEFIRPLCDLLQNHIGPGEIAELYEQFAREYFGDSRYEVVQHIENRMLEMGQREDDIDRAVAAAEFDVENFLQEFLVPERAHELIHKIYQMLEEEKADAALENRNMKLYLYVPSYWKYLRTLLIVMCNRNETYKNMDFKCVFSGNTTLHNKEIAQVEDFLAAYGLAIYNLNVCDIMDNKSSFVELDLLPYYIITKKKILLISGDGRTFIDISEPKLVAKMMAQYLTAISEKGLFMGKLDESIYFNRVTSVKVGNEKSYVMGNHLCLEPFFSETDMKQFVGNKLPYADVALMTAIQFYQDMQKADLNMVFASNTLFEMVEDKGPESGKQLETLEKLYEHYMAHPEKQIYTFDSKRYRFNNRMHLNLLVEKVIIALDYDEVCVSLFDKNLAMLLIPRVVEYFKDFYEYFTHSTICVNREHTLEMIKMCIETKRKMVCDGIEEK